MKKLIICLLIFSFLLQVGCTSSSYINADKYSDEIKSDLTGVILKDSTEYELGRVYNNELPCCKQTEYQSKYLFSPQGTGN